MPDDRDADLFEASLMLLAGTTRLHYDANAGRGKDAWAVVGASADSRLQVEFETEPAAARFTDVMRAVPEATCRTGRRVAGIRRRYETFVVDVGGAEPSIVVGRLRGEWIRNAGLLLGNGAADEPALRTRAAAVWRSALLTAAPKVSAAGLRLCARDWSTVRLLVRAAQVLGVACQARTARGFQGVHVEGRGVITLLATVRSLPGPVGGPRARRASLQPSGHA
ncbi:hypothetical protein [Dactylosporangium sp. NPDC048998]|uniref:hypothetical protein n=1 Tax=Dactylosporangium sp. NPDC048998 TaxID=3363976 RepID=UPI00371EC217